LVKLAQVLQLDTEGQLIVWHLCNSLQLVTKQLVQHK